MQPEPGRPRGRRARSASYLRASAIPLVVVAGGLAAGFLVHTCAPEGHGAKSSSSSGVASSCETLAS